MRHRPIKKINRSPYILILGVAVNLIIVSLFYGTLNLFDKTDGWRFPGFHFFLLYASIFFFGISVPTFIISSTMEPGYLKKKYDFVSLVSEFMAANRDLISLCTYCQLIKSETSFHC